MRTVPSSGFPVSSSLSGRILSERGTRNAKRFCLALALLLTTSLPVLAKSSSSEFVMFREVHVSPGETRDRDLICFGCTITIEGTLDGDLVGIGTTLGVSGSITGDTVIVGSAALGEHARLTGDLVTVGGRLQRAPGAVTTGDVVTAGGFASGIGIAGVVFAFMLPMVVIGLLAVLLAFAIMGQQRVATVAVAIHQHAGAAVVIGALVCAACVLLIPVLLVARPFGGTIGSLVWLAVMLVSVGGYAGLSFALGRRLTPRSSALAITMLGAIVIAILVLIPMVGLLMWLLLTSLAIGGCVLSGFGSSAGWLWARRAAAERAPQ